MIYTYRSETFTMAATGDKRQVPLSFIPQRGPRGQRIVISKLRIKQVASFTTGGGQSVTAAGQADVLKNFRLWDAQGELWRVKGSEIRLKHIETAGRRAQPDPALVGAGVGPVSRTFLHVIDLAPDRGARRRWDTAVPIDVLLAGGGMELESEAQGSIGTGGVTLNSLTMQVFAECREEHDLEGHARREVRSYSSANLTDLYLNANGALIRSALAFKPADHITGGTDLSSTTDVTIEAFGINSIVPDILQSAKVLEGDHDWASTTDPFVQTTARVICLVSPKRDEKLTELLGNDGQILARLNGNTVNNLPIVMDLITRQTAASTMAERNMGAAPVAAKTASKTAKSLGGWAQSGLDRYMPKKYGKV